MAKCTHTNQIKTDIEAQTPEGCGECLKSGDGWVALRKCLVCGHIGCCDSSVNKHARKHFEKTEHPIIEPYKETRNWRWCYVDDMYIE